MDKSTFKTAKVNLKTIKIPYVVTGAAYLLLTIVDIIKLFMFRNGSDIGEQTNISTGNLLWLLIPLAAIFIATKNLHRTVNLGGKRKQFFAGSLITYLILAAGVSLACTLVYYFWDALIKGSDMYKGYVNLMDVWGWSAHGAVIAFLQQFAFFLLLATFVHTLSLVQDAWYGWVTDVLIAVVVVVSISFSMLRGGLFEFFRLILFHPNVILQIMTCVVLATILYTISWPVLMRKKL